MTERLSFPENDLAQLKADCEELQSILVDHLAPHCAWLRALQRRSEGDPIQPSMAWSEEHTISVVRHGFWGACEKRLVSHDLLRHAANEPALLESLLERALGEGPVDLWFPHTGGIPASVDDLTHDLFDKLAAPDRSHMSSASGPLIESTETKDLLPAVPVRLGNYCIWRIEVSVAKIAELSLRFGGKLWGKLCIQRMSPTQLTTLACTGVFLSQEGFEELPLRAAARTKLPNHEESHIEIQATIRGVVVDIVIIDT